MLKIDLSHLEKLPCATVNGSTMTITMPPETDEQRRFRKWWIFLHEFNLK